MKSLEQQLTEQAAEIRELRKKVGKPGAGAAVSLVRELSESGLPEPAIARLKRKLPATASASAIKAAIAEEKHYVRGVRSSATLEIQESRLVQSYRALGLNKAEASIAAGVQVAVEQISESRQKLLDAGKLLGMSPRECEIFSRM